MERRRSGNLRVMTGLLPALLLMVSVLLQGCGKNGGVCVSNSGPIVKQVRNVADFNQINLNDNVCLILTTDTVSPVVVEAGQNLLGGISTKVENGQLTVGNSNTCNWLRDYNKPLNVYLSVQNLWKIKYNSSGDIHTSGTLNMDSISVEVWGGCGTIDLTLNVMSSNFSLNMGTVDYRIRGISAITSVYMAAYGLYDARALKTEFTFITNKGTNDCYVWATKSLAATIESIGSIYYKGNPPTIQTTIRGAGTVQPF